MFEEVNLDKVLEDIEAYLSDTDMVSDNSTDFLKISKELMDYSMIGLESFDIYNT